MATRGIASRLRRRSWSATISLALVVCDGDAPGRDLSPGVDDKLSEVVLVDAIEGDRDPTAAADMSAALVRIEVGSDKSSLVGGDGFAGCG